MKLSAAVDLYVLDMRSQGRMNSNNTELAYRRVLNAHAEDVQEQDPGATTRNDVKTTLRRWEHPNSQRQAHAVLASFYGWTIEEGLRETINPAQQVRRARQRKPSVYRPTREEVVRLMKASKSRRRDNWVIHLGVLAGARREEIRGFQGRHFQVEGWVWVSADIAKGQKERWVPVLPELAPVVDEIRQLVGRGDYVIPSQRTVDPPFHKTPVERPDKQISGSGLYKLVKRVGERAELGAEIGPHTLRHAYGDHVARYAGLRIAQAVLGHESVATTEGSYMGRVTRDEIAASLNGFRYDHDFQQGPTGAEIPDSSSDAR